MGAGNTFPTPKRTGRFHAPSHSMLGPCNLQLSEPFFKRQTRTSLSMAILCDLAIHSYTPASFQG